MFQKAYSSTLSNARKDASKRAKDIPIRKSDRRALRDKALTILTSDDGDQLSQQLDICFLQGSLVSRQVHLPEAKVTLYFRSPLSAESSVGDHDWPYSLQPQCIWMELDSKTLCSNNCNKPVTVQMPTVALLSFLPPRCISTVTVPEPVSKFLCRGANLMRPGMRDLQLLLPESSTNQQQNNSKKSNSDSNLCPVAVAIQGNPQPFAVGLLAPDLLPCNDSPKVASMNGVGVTIVTAYGDDLWKQQLPSLADRNAQNETMSLFNQGHYGNPGFVDGQRVCPIIFSQEGTGDAEGQRNGGDCDECGDSQDQQALKHDLRDATCGGEGGGNDSGTDSKDAISANTVGEEIDPAQEGGPSPEEVLHMATCRALAALYTQRKKLLPMRMATFYAQHVLPNRPEGTTIELKRTKYKKFAVYIAEQAELDLLTVGTSNDGGTKDPLGMLTGVNARHNDLRPLLQANREQQQQEPKTGANRKVVLLDLYCIPEHFKNLLKLDPASVRAENATSDERKGTGMLTLKEVRAILDGYIEREELSMASMIAIDGPLKDALYKGKKSSKADAPTTVIPENVARKDLAAQWTSKLNPAFALVEMPGSRIIRLGRGPPPSVTLEVSRRQSNKFVTTLRGFGHFDVEADYLCREISQRFACSAKVVTIPRSGRSDDVEILVQGNLCTELEALLSGDARKTSHGGAKDSPFCIPSKAIQVVLRKGVPARKKRK